MRSNNQQENKALTPMQKQAVLVCIVCALAALLTIGITLTMLKRGKNPTEQPGASSIITPAPAPEGEEDVSDHYQINKTSSALLTGTADAGNAYQEQMSDFASRGLLQSTLYDQARNDMLGNFNRQRTDMDTAQTNFLEELARALSAQKSDTQLGKDQARVQALARRAAAEGGMSA